MMLDDNSVVRVSGYNNNGIDLVVTTGTYDADGQSTFTDQYATYVQYFAGGGFGSGSALAAGDTVWYMTSENHDMWFDGSVDSGYLNDVRIVNYEMLSGVHTAVDTVALGWNNVAWHEDALGAWNPVTSTPDTFYVETAGIINTFEIAGDAGYYWAQQGFVTEGLVELYDWSMAFSNDGNTGYLVAQGTDANGQIVPFVHMTTDAGATWAQTSLDFSAIEGYVSPAYNGGIDCAVDANGTLHMMVSVFEQDESVEEINRKLYDVRTDGSTWSANYISDINTERVADEDAAAIHGVGYNHRIQASKSADETKVFAIWTDVNVDEFDVELLEFPDVYAHGLDVNTNLSTGVRNFTEATELEGANFWMFASPNAVSTDGGFAIPVTTSTAGGDALTTMEHYYVGGVEFLNSEFIINPNAILGCMDSLAINFNIAAEIDDGSCEYLWGCTEEWADNYNQFAYYNDGSCYHFGCTDFFASNWDEFATYNDGSCVYTCEVPSDWESINTGSNMTLMIPGDIEVLINGSQVSEGSAIGVFYEDSYGALQCAGYSYLTSDTTHIAVMADDSTTDDIDGLVSGTEMIWIIWDGVSCMEYSGSAVFSLGSNIFTPNGIAFVQSVSYSCQDIVFPSGWFIFSTYIESEDMEVTAVLSSLGDNIIIVKNNNGDAYLPEWDFNGIGSLENGQGYSIKLQENDQVEICGDYLIPELNPITLSSGWNTIGYLRIDPANVEMIMESLVSNDNLIIVKDYDGNPYLPEWNYNGIGDMHPGQGYQLKINNTDTLHYLSNDQQYRISTAQVVENSADYFAKVTPTGNNMQIVIPENVLNQDIELGAEIAAYNSNGLLVGSTVYSNPTTVLTIWGDDATTRTIDGLQVDESIVFKVWNKEQLRDLRIENWAVGSNAYQVDAIHVAAAIEIEEIIQTTNLFDAIPNPSQTKTNISFFVAEAQRVNISVYNVVGELIEVLANSVYKAGTHELEMQVSHIEPGSYLYTMRAGNFEKTKQLVILK